MVSIKVHRTQNFNSFQCFKAYKERIDTKTYYVEETWRIVFEPEAPSIGFESCNLVNYQISQNFAQHIKQATTTVFVLRMRTDIEPLFTVQEVSVNSYISLENPFRPCIISTCFDSSSAQSTMMEAEDESYYVDEVDEVDDADDSAGAPIFEVPPRKIVAIEHPCVILNLDKGLATFGPDPDFQKVGKSTFIASASN